MIKHLFYLIKRYLPLLLINLLLFTLVVIFWEDSSIITQVFADSDDESETEPSNPKLWKGKEKEVLHEPFQKTPYLHDHSDETEVSQAEQEAFDLEYAKYLQDEEYKLWDNTGEGGEDDDNCSEYTVISSNIHDSDTESLKQKKLEIKEKEKGLKRKFEEEPESSSNKKQK